MPLLTPQPNPHRIGACPECGSYRSDGRAPYLHKPGCSKEGDPQIERWLAEEAAGASKKQAKSEKENVPMMSNRAPAHDDLLHAHNHDWPSGVPRNEPHEHPHTGPGHAGFTHLHPHLHAPAGSVPAPGAPQCEADGVRNGPDGPGGTEFYWSCTAPGTVDVDGILMCDDHAGERGYGPKQEDYGYDRGVT